MSLLLRRRAIIGGAGVSGPPLSDTFDRANNTSSLGTATTGQTWSTLVGTMGIISNQAYASALSGGVAAAVVESTVSNGYVQVDFTYPSSGNGLNPGVIFRAQDLNNLLWVDVSHNPTGSGDDRVRLVKTNTGTTTVLSSVVVTGTTVQLSTTHELKVTYNSSGNIEVFVDAVSRLTFTLSAGDQTTYGSRTKVGLRSDSTAHRFNDLASGT